MNEYWKLTVLALLVCPAAAGAAPDTTPNDHAASVGDATPQPSPAAVCNNGLIESGESCDDCPSDCDADRPCAPTSRRRTATVDLIQADGTFPLGFAVRIAYRGDKLSLPGSEFDSSIGERIATSKESSHVVARDVEHSLRLVVTDASGLNDTSFRITFDVCEGADAANDDAICWIEGCTSRGIDIRGCACAVTEIR